jgi:lipid II:glycine glycyltransferase (peptidoglycan interpeptide bridge formation enzyme)
MQKLPANWDDTQKSLNASILQSAGWAEFQGSLGRELYFGEGNGWSWVGFARASKGIKYLFLPYGPTIQSDTSACLRHVIQTAKDNNFDFIRLEPIGKVTSQEMVAIGGQKIAELDPEHTQLIDLTKSIDELRSDLRSGHRNPINQAEKRGVQVYSSTEPGELKDFLLLMASTAKRAGITNYDDNYYARLAETLMPLGMARFYVATVEGKKVSMSIVYDYHSTRSYAWAGNDAELNRKSQASVINVWQMITGAKEAGMHTFDLWGVAPVDAAPGHKWAGISVFKRGFGGETVETLGTWDVPIKQNKYKAYKVYRKLRKLDT